MEKNRIMIIIIIGLIIALVLAGAAGWSLGKGSSSNNIQEKSISSAGSASAQSTNDLFSGEKPKDIVTLRVSTGSGVPATGRITLGDKYGFYEAEGIKIQYVNVPTGLALAALQKGEIDVLGGHPDVWINAIKGGAKVKAVIGKSAGHPRLPHDSAYVLKDSPIREPKDLIGKKIGGMTQASWYLSCMGFFWSRYFKINGISPDQVIPVNIPTNQQEQAIQQGLIDVVTAHAGTGWIDTKPEKWRKLWASPELFDNMVDIQDADISMDGFTEEFIKKNPDVVKRYMRAYIMASAFDNDNHDIFVDWVTTKLLGKNQNQSIYDRGDHHNLATGLIREKAVQRWIDWYVEAGFLKPGEIKPTDLYTNEFNPYSKYKENDVIKNPTYWDNYPVEYLPKKGNG